MNTTTMKRNRNNKRKIMDCKKDNPRKKVVSLKPQNSWFPLEVIIDILSRLPVKSLQKFKCVSKSWNSTITEDSYMVAQHLKNRLRHPNNSDGIISLSCSKRLKYSAVVAYRCTHYTRPTLNYSVGDDYSGPVKFALPEALDEEEHRRHYYITNSCNGLVGIFGFRNFYIANSGIRKLALLPQRSSNKEMYINVNYPYPPDAGIGFDASTGEYKAVRLFQYYNSYLFLPGFTGPWEDSRTGCEVCTLGVDSCWKFVGDAPFQPYQIPQKDYSQLPVVVNGAIHWTALRLASRGQKPEIALAFNLTDEKFDVIMHPEGSSRPALSRVVALAGRLCVADTPNSAAPTKIWALTDYKNREWVKLYDIDLVGMPRRLLKVPVTIRSDGIVVLFDGEGRRDYYDPQTERFLMYEISEEDRDGIVSRFTYKNRFERLVTYTDSLVWPWPTDACTV